MNTSAWVLLGVFLVLLAAIAWPLAAWIECVISGRFVLLKRLESPVWKLAGIRSSAQHGWRTWCAGLLMFNAAGIVLLYFLQVMQDFLPLNPRGLPAPPWDVAINTAVSFVTNTNWQSYSGEATLSLFTQMAGLTVQNFLSAATGIVVAIALIRGFSTNGPGMRRGMAATAGPLGNVWVDLVRVTLWVLLPLSVVVALAFVASGVVQTLDAAVSIHPAGAAVHDLALGPVASQGAIKLLGTNGGGFFNTNSAHPFENPTYSSNLLEMLAILAIPAALCLVFGRMVGDRRQGYALLAAMTLLFVLAVVSATHFEQQVTPALASPLVDATASATQAGGNMEGKEVRFGVDASALFAVVTTSASAGAVNAAHDSFSALGGAVPMILIQLGEVVFGGVGSGLYGMLLFAVLTVFVAGLMIGRTPEYLGKKIGASDMKSISVALLLPPLVVLGGTALAVVVPGADQAIGNPGAHGFSEMLYAFSSAANNNGSAFGGLSAGTPFWNVSLAVAMLIGRFGVIVAVLILAGSLAGRPRLAVTAGTLPTHGALFILLLAGMVLLAGLLNFVPALALGPFAEHLQDALLHTAP